MTNAEKHSAMAQAVFGDCPASCSLPAVYTTSAVAKMRPVFQAAPCQPIHLACSALSSVVMYTPSAQMSCVDDEKAKTHRIAMMILKYCGSGNAMAIKPSKIAIKNSMLSTQNFLVRYMSRKEAQNGFNDQAMPTLPVASAISVSVCPKSLNIVPATQITSEKGMPIAT